MITTHSQQVTLISWILLLAVAPHSSHSQQLLSIEPYELSVEDARASSVEWKKSPGKVRALLDIDLEEYYYKGVVKTAEARKKMEGELQIKKDQFLNTTYSWETVAPAVFDFGEDSEYSITQHGFTTALPIYFPQVPKKRITWESGAVTFSSDVYYVDDIGFDTHKFEENQTDYNFLWLFQVADDSEHIRTERVRLMIFNKYSEEVVYDHIF